MEKQYTSFCLKQEYLYTFEEKRRRKKREDNEEERN